MYLCSACVRANTYNLMESAVNGYYKLTWRERIGFCSGELAQNLIYQSPYTPMIIEHLTTDEEYVSSVRYVKSVLTNLKN